MKTYTKQDCDQTGYGFLLTGRIVVLSESALPEDHPGQLFFCAGGDGADPDPIGDTVVLVSLSTGEQHCFRRGGIIGTLKQDPGLLPDEARLQLSQIRPIGAKDLRDHEPQFSGYSFLPDGRYAAGVWLCSPREAVDYVEMQKPYQHRVLLCDRDDFAVMEVVNGRTVFPLPEDLEKFCQEQKQGGGQTMV